MIYSFFPGRWQPFHKGHKMLVQKVLDENRNICIAIRDTKISKDNPYTYKERKKMIRKEFPDKEKVMIMKIPDIEEVVHGRKVGWGIREIKLDAEIEKISATKIRTQEQE